MAVRFDAAADMLSTTTGAPTTANYTAMFWVRLEADRNASGNILVIVNSGATAYHQVYVTTDGTTLRSNITTNTTTIQSLTVGTWYHVTVVRNGNDSLFYVNGSYVVTHTQSSSMVGAQMYLGSDGTQYINGDMAHLKTWEAALSAAEVAQEYRVALPRRTANLRSWYPMFSGSGNRGKDWSGKGLNLTEGGTLADVAGPPVSWGGPSWMVPFVASGGDTTITGTGFSDSDSFGSGTISTGSDQTITGSGLADSDSFGAGAVTQATAITGLGYTGWGMRFNGNGSDVNRVRIPLDSPTDPPVDVGAGDFCYEFWMRAAYADNTSTATDEDARYSNIILDKDIWAHQRGWALGATRSGSNLILCFGVAGASLTWSTIYTTSNIGNNAWHHVRLNRSGNTVRIFVDGVQEASGTYAGDLSYPNGYTPTGGKDGAYLVIGCEKSDLGYFYNGSIDSLRVSDVSRGTATFTPPSRHDIDGDTVALFPFIEGTGTVVSDALGGPSGEVLYGGSPAGPVWAEGYAPDTFNRFGGGSITVGAAVITGTGFADGDSFGTGALSTTISLPGTGFADSDAFGAGAISASYGIQGSGLSDSDSFGAGSLSAQITLGGTGLADGDSFGAGTIVRGAVNIGGTGFADSDSFGAGAVTLGGTIISGTGFSDSDSFGAGTIVRGVVTLSGTGYSDSDSFGSGTIGTAITVVGVGFSDGDSFGAGLVSLGGTIVSGTGFTDGDSFGAGSISVGTVTITGSGYADSDSFGAGSLSAGAITITGTGFVNSSGFGSGSLQFGGISIGGTGFQNTNTFGAGSLLAAITITGTGIADVDSFGAGTLTLGAVTIQGAGFVNVSNFGQGTIGFAMPFVLLVAPGMAVTLVAEPIASSVAAVSETIVIPQSSILAVSLVPVVQASMGAVAIKNESPLTPIAASVIM